MRPAARLASARPPSDRTLTLTDVKEALAIGLGDILSFSYEPVGAEMRPGFARVVGVDRELGQLLIEQTLFATVPTACNSDYIFVASGMNSSVDHHAVLVAYLKSAVERGDWHAVSDAANDLRVLEASRR